MPSAGQPYATQGVVIFDALDTEVDKAWLNTLEVVPGLFIPMIADEE